MEGMRTENAIEPHITTDLLSIDTTFSACQDLDSPGSISSPDSLFDDFSELFSSDTGPAALINAPPIPGLFFTPSLRLPADLADSVMNYCLETFFTSANINQIMLFCRAPSAESPNAPSGLPPPLISLLDVLSDILRPTLPHDIHSLLFPTVPTRARQAIINRYDPGEGITAHVDLLKRFGDGIVGVSFGSGCVMQFASGSEDEAYGVYLPEGSIIVMSGDARYKWTHGIERKTMDYVQSPDTPSAGRWVKRTMRVSITFRWLLPGAEVVGST
ncbi:hypothetical protein IW261DRAFT_97844 [Armillaria novae-zelandiae]|uniref:Fe2OG dioxygenase domain-containing protein n=1 Tax=Armillaria novae-zelandiae TaxID=153914 RepID=A0AA39UKG4_9AGAR|nr:hypothetical protein IW261DRAFT_97844 [Armillaria novae-zelandiae]